MLFSFIISLFAATSVFADRSRSSRTSSLSSLASSDVCTQELEGIVYIPKTCSYNYLKAINKVLKAQSPLLWGSPAQAKAVIESFQATYGVIVKVVDAFGTVYNFPGDAPLANTPKPKTHSYAQSMGIGEGFSASTYPAPTVTTSLSDRYSSIYWNPDGQMYIVGLIMDSSKAPMFC